MSISRFDLIKISIPLIIGSLLEPIASVIDNAFVGNLSTSWLASLAYGTMILSSFSWIFNFIIHVTTESISKKFETGSKDDLIGMTQISLLIGLSISLFTILFLYLFYPILFELIGVKEELFQVTRKYFLIRLIGHPFTILFLTTISLLRGISKTKETMIFLLISVVLNSGFNYLFLYIYQFGPEYAAWGTNIAMFVAFVFSLIFHLRSIDGKMILKERQFSLKDFFSFSSKSIHLFVRSLSLTSIFFLSTRIAGKLGVVELAAHQILLQFWLFASFFIDGVAVVANIYLARWSHSGKTDKVKWLLKEVFFQGGCFGFIFTLVYFFGENWLLAKFSNDLSVINTIKTIWPYIVFGQLINAFAFVVDGCLFGSGDYRYLKNMMVGIFCFVFIPFALLAVYQEQLLFLWLGLIAVSISRLIIGGIKVNKID